MSNRHLELRRQHQMLREHLAWLEKEIAREAAAGAPDAPENPVHAPIFPVAAQTAPVADMTDADALLSQYADTERHDPSATKRGCLLAFALVMALMVGTLTVIYFLFYAHR